MLLASSREWLASALRAVLEPAGFAFEHASTGAAALERASAAGADVVIVDEGLPDRSVPELCGDLAGLSTGPSLPILVYSPAFWHESEQAAAMRAGAWDVVREPIRSRLLVAKLERLIQIRRLIEVSEDGGLSTEPPRILELSDMVRFLPVISALAGREAEPLSCAVLGPSSPPEAPTGAGDRRRALVELASRAMRRSDLCAWIGDEEVVVLAFGADLDGLGSMFERLAARAPGEMGLSAGFVTLVPAGGDRTAEEPSLGSVPERVAVLDRIAAAQAALARARETGGGCRVAEIS